MRMLSAPSIWNDRPYEANSLGIMLGGTRVKDALSRPLEPCLLTGMYQLLTALRVTFQEVREVQEVSLLILKDLSSQTLRCWLGHQVVVGPGHQFEIQTSLATTKRGALSPFVSRQRA